MNAGIAADAFGWSWEQEALRWDWTLYPGLGSSQFDHAASLPSKPSLLRRGYLKSTTTLAPSTRPAGFMSAGSWVAPVQLSSYPHPQPEIAVAGRYAHATWVVDDPARVAVNRTTAVFSSYDGGAWANPWQSSTTAPRTSPLG